MIGQRECINKVRQLNDIDYRKGLRKGLNSFKINVNS